MRDDDGQVTGWLCRNCLRAGGGDDAGDESDREV